MTDDRTHHAPAETALEARTGLASGPGSTEAHGGSETVYDMQRAHAIATDWLHRYACPVNDQHGNASRAVCMADMRFKAGFLVAALMPSMVQAIAPKADARIRRQERERIARAIEVARGDRCPECGGKAAFRRVDSARIGRGCGGGHVWSHPERPWANYDPAAIARTAPEEGR